MLLEDEGDETRPRGCKYPTSYGARLLNITRDDPAGAIIHHVRVVLHNLSYGNEFDLQDKKRTRKTDFYTRSCARSLFEIAVKVTWKWPLDFIKDVIYVIY